MRNSCGPHLVSLSLFLCVSLPPKALARLAADIYFLNKTTRMRIYTSMGLCMARDGEVHGLGRVYTRVIPMTGNRTHCHGSTENPRSYETHIDTKMKFKCGYIHHAAREYVNTFGSRAKKRNLSHAGSDTNSFTRSNYTPARLKTTNGSRIFTYQRRTPNSSGTRVKRIF